MKSSCSWETHPFKTQPVGEYREQWDEVGCEVLGKSFIQPYCRAAAWESGHCCWLMICLELKTGWPWAFLPGLDPHSPATSTQSWPITNSSTSLVMHSQTKLRSQRGFAAIQGLQDWVLSPHSSPKSISCCLWTVVLFICKLEKPLHPKELCHLPAASAAAETSVGSQQALHSSAVIPIQIRSSSWGADNLSFGCSTSRWDGLQ